MNAPARKPGPNGTTGAPRHPDTARPAEGFAFRCRGHACRGWLQDDRHGHGVYVACDVGILPYTAENRDGRRSALLVLSRAGSMGRSRLMLTEFHRISVVTRVPVADHTDSVAILSAAATAALAGMPLVDLIFGCLAVRQATDD